MYSRPVEKPTAPSRMARSISDCILRISSGVARRLAAPITSRRTLLWPTSERDIDAEAELVELVEPRREVQLGAAAVAGDDGGDAVEQEVVGARIALDVAFDVSVDVDEAGRDDALAGVDGARGGRAGKRADGGDAAVLTATSGAKQGLPLPSMTRALRIRTS